MELHELSATEAVGMLKRGEVSPLELVDAAIARTEATNAAVNAIVTPCYERARAHARRLMKERREERPAHSLHGLPIAVKDNTDVEGVRCTYGSRIYAERIAPASDLVVRRLEANGAIVIGKTNLPEFAAGGNTFNDVFGATRNPWDTRMTPSGSSGGSASALACGQVWLATGNDFGGSIRTPASFCSITGLRPSPGMVARVQKQPYSPLSVEGPMARTVSDVALMFDAEAGFHAHDPLSQVGPHPCYAAAAAQPLRPARVAFSIDLGIAPVVDREVAAVCRSAVEKLAADGVAVDEKHPDLRDAGANFLTLRGAVYVARMAEHLKTHRGLLKPEVVENTEYGLSLTAAQVVAAEVVQGDVARRMARCFEDYDVLLAPAVLCPPFPVERRYIEEWDGVRFDGYMGWLILTYAVSLTACPVIAMPAGFTSAGLPVGLQAIGRPRGEAELFSVASYLEDVFGVARRTPIDPMSR